nr:ABC transporter ATP-binding protein [Henriciella barbarensis]
MATFETVGIASTMPFLAVLGNPSLIETNPLLSQTYEIIGTPGIDRFLFLLGSGAFILLVITAAVRIVTNYAINRYTQMRSYSVSERLLNGYFRQAYPFFLDRHSGDLAARTIVESSQAVSATIKPFMTLVASIITMAMIITLLVVVDPVTALVAGSILGGAYGLIFAVTKGFLSRIGQERVVANRERFASVSDALNGIKVIKVLGREQTYLKRFRMAAIKVARSQAASMTLGQLPKFAIEAVAFGGIILLCLVLMARQGGADGEALGEVLPILGLYAFAGYRLLPTFQSAYQSISAMRFGAAAIDSVYEDLVLREDLHPLPRGTVEPLGLHDSIEFRALSFSYPGSDGVGLKEVSVTIPIGSRVGVVGSTGAGKTTLMDVLLGLLEATSGEMLIDGKPITSDNVRSWQQTIGYVPQEIFLVDASIAENIALGMPSEQIDRVRVAECARMAQVHEFIIEDLPEGYDTKVGERGVRLSGGQRQRLGIARALYHDPDLIVFDEATSALDNLTEKEVMAAVDKLSRQKTIIMVAHRISTVRECDMILVLEKGKLVAQGPYTELMIDSEAFQAIVGGA